MIEWTLPIKTVSESNCSQHWSKKHKRHKIQQTYIIAAFYDAKPLITFPCTVVFTRISPRKLDSDNLISAFKWIRDEVANQIFPLDHEPRRFKMGRNDDDPRITWKYGQEYGKVQAVRIQIY